MCQCYYTQQKPKTSTLKDVTLAEAGKYGTLNEYAFFDKVSIQILPSVLEGISQNQQGALLQMLGFALLF